MPSKSSFEFLNAGAASQGNVDPEGARQFLARFGYIPAQASAFGEVAAVAGAAPPSTIPDVSDALRQYHGFIDFPLPVNSMRPPPRRCHNHDAVSPIS